MSQQMNDHSSYWVFNWAVITSQFVLALALSSESAQVSVGSFNQPLVQCEGVWSASGRWTALIAEQGTKEMMGLIFSLTVSGKEILWCNQLEQSGLNRWETAKESKTNIQALQDSCQIQPNIFSKLHLVVSILCIYLCWKIFPPRVRSVVFTE